MQDGCTNIYLAARNSAGYTREKAAEMIPCSVRSLANYESGVSIPSNNVVARMMGCYNSQYLGCQHLLENNVLAARIVPQLEQHSVLEMAVRIYNRLNRFSAKNSVERLMEIAEDGVIDEEERGEFYAIMTDLREIVKSGLELEMFCGGNPYADDQ